MCVQNIRNRCPGKGKRLLGMQKEEEAQEIWILGKVSLVGAKFGGIPRGLSFLVKSSTTALPLFKHVTLLSIKACCSCKRKGGPVG